MWEAAQKSEFATIRYELAVAIARTTTRVEHVCQEVLHWARQLQDSTTFAAHINHTKFASEGMRNFVDVFRANLAAAGAPTDDETVWRLLRCFQILVFDFKSPGSGYEHRVRERSRLALATDQANRSADLWPVLIDRPALARGGAVDRPAVVTSLKTQHGFRFDQRADLRPLDARLLEAADRALAEIKDQVGGVSLPRTELIDQAYAALEARLRHSLTEQVRVSQELGKTLEELKRSTEDARKLQGQLQVVCAWTKRINIEGRWVALDEFLTHQLNTKITYGVSPEAMQEVLVNVEQSEFPETFPIQPQHAVLAGSL